MNRTLPLNARVGRQLPWSVTQSPNARRQEAGMPRTWRQLCSAWPSSHRTSSPLEGTHLSLNHRRAGRLRHFRPSNWGVHAWNLQRARKQVPPGGQGISYRGLCCENGVTGKAWESEGWGNLMKPGKKRSLTRGGQV